MSGPNLGGFWITKWLTTSAIGQFSIPGMALRANTMGPSLITGAGPAAFDGFYFPSSTRSFSYTMAGGMVLAGSDIPLRRAHPSASGGVSFAGSAAELRKHAKTMLGGVLFGGSAPVTFHGGGGGPKYQHMRRKTSVRDLFIN